MSDIVLRRETPVDFAQYRCPKEVLGKEVDEAFPVSVYGKPELPVRLRYVHRDLLVVRDNPILINPFEVNVLVVCHLSQEPANGRVFVIAYPPVKRSPGIDVIWSSQTVSIIDQRLPSL
jgi:hypothetical protein